MSNLDNFKIILSKYLKLQSQINVVKELIKEKNKEHMENMIKYKNAIKNSQKDLATLNKAILNYMKDTEIYQVGLPNGDKLEYKKYVSKRKIPQTQIYKKVFEKYKDNTEFNNYIDELKSIRIEKEVETVKIKKHKDKNK